MIIFVWAVVLFVILAPFIFFVGMFLPLLFENPPKHPKGDNGDGVQK